MSEYIGLVPPEGGFVQTEQFNFARYSAGERYRQVNIELVRKALGMLPQRRLTGLDVATGHGMVPRIVSAEVTGTDRYVRQINTDIDAYAIETAKREIPSTPNIEQIFIQGDALALPDVLSDVVAEGEVDYTSIHDALHEVRKDEIKRGIIGNQTRMLRPGGILSFNSAFTDLAMGMEWGIWQSMFMKLIGASKYRGEQPIESLPIHAPAFYRALILEQGLVIAHEDIPMVPHYQEELEGISEYPPFARGFAEKMIFDRPVGLAEAVDYMKRSIPLTLQRIKSAYMPRTWYELIAQKPK